MHVKTPGIGAAAASVATGSIATTTDESGNDA